ncbi:MAG: hypothetical protein LBI56_01230 [Puniceicoccales bacterium]|jgi:hypothetical protein|nr:hypothetical protein [Puniceicoccales bacterium]
MSSIENQTNIDASILHKENSNITSPLGTALENPKGSLVENKDLAVRAAEVKVMTSENILKILEQVSGGVKMVFDNIPGKDFLSSATVVPSFWNFKNALNDAIEEASNLEGYNKDGKENLLESLRGALRGVEDFLASSGTSLSEKKAFPAAIILGNLKNLQDSILDITTQAEALKKKEGWAGKVLKGFAIGAGIIAVAFIAKHAFTASKPPEPNANGLVSEPNGNGLLDVLQNSDPGLLADAVEKFGLMEVKYNSQNANKNGAGGLKVIFEEGMPIDELVNLEIVLGEDTAKLEEYTANLETSSGPFDKELLEKLQLLIDQYYKLRNNQGKTARNYGQLMAKIADAEANGKNTDGLYKELEKIKLSHNEAVKKRSDLNKQAEALRREVSESLNEEKSNQPVNSENRSRLTNEDQKLLENFDSYIAKFQKKDKSVCKEIENERKTFFREVSKRLFHTSLSDAWKRLETFKKRFFDLTKQFKASEGEERWNVGADIDKLYDEINGVLRNDGNFRKMFLAITKEKDCDTGIAIQKLYTIKQIRMMMFPEEIKGEYQKMKFSNLSPEMKRDLRKAFEAS